MDKKQIVLEGIVYTVCTIFYLLFIISMIVIYQNNVWDVVSFHFCTGALAMIWFGSKFETDNTFVIAAFGFSGPLGMICFYVILLCTMMSCLDEAKAEVDEFDNFDEFNKWFEGLDK